MRRLRAAKRPGPIHAVVVPLWLVLGGRRAAVIDLSGRITCLGFILVYEIHLYTTTLFVFVYRLTVINLQNSYDVDNHILAVS